MIVLDASVIIAYLDADDEHHARAEGLLAREIDDEFGANSLTLAEVLVAPTRENRLEDARAVLHDLEVQELPLPPETAVKLAQVHALTNVKMPDCCVLLAAEHLVARIGSFDDRLLRAAATRNLEALEH
ncbi:MAG: type II toxin-antitoxin system VapC family toxin [Streptosporangiales bacterium]